MSCTRRTIYHCLLRGLASYRLEKVYLSSTLQSKRPPASLGRSWVVLDMAGLSLDGIGLIFSTQGIDTAPLEHASVLELTREPMAQELDRETR